MSYRITSNFLLAIRSRAPCTFVSSWHISMLHLVCVCGYCLFSLEPLTMKARTWYECMIRKKQVLTWREDKQSRAEQA